MINVYSYRQWSEIFFGLVAWYKGTSSFVSLTNHSAKLFFSTYNDSVAITFIVNNILYEYVEKKISQLCGPYRYLSKQLINVLPTPTRRITKADNIFLMEIGEYWPVPSLPVSSSHDIAASVPIATASFKILSIVPLSSRISM